MEIREIQASDLNGIKAVVRDVWEWEEAFDDEDVIDACVAIYFAPVLHEATFGRVAVLDGEIVGVIFGLEIGKPAAYKHILEDLTPHILRLTQTNDQDRQAMCDYITALHTTYAALIADTEHEYDGSLDFFAVSKAVQGQGVGKQLWQQLKSHFQRQNIKKIYLYSDSECNYQFYEGQGFVRVQTQEMRVNFGGEEDVTEQFLYSCELG
ncbi:MAG: GNAT family N-acetyltransferase [Turicibacter sp.]|nr:GNAT family N-acetyltransferase [Turicibacter sp.]